MTKETEIALFFTSAFAVVGLLAFVLLVAMRSVATLIYQIFWQG